MEASHKTHRPHIKVGKDEEKKNVHDIGLQYTIIFFFFKCMADSGQIINIVYNNIAAFSRTTFKIAQQNDDISYGQVEFQK